MPALALGAAARRLPTCPHPLVHQRRLPFLSSSQLARVQASGGTSFSRVLEAMRACYAGAAAGQAPPGGATAAAPKGSAPRATATKPPRKVLVTFFTDGQDMHSGGPAAVDVSLRALQAALAGAGADWQVHCLGERCRPAAGC